MVMKTAKPPPPAAEAPSSSRRSQPVRQARTNPTRNTAAHGRAHTGRDGAAGGSSHEQPIEIFPGIMHFADAITALPRELVRHFTLLKEVDAKVHAPELDLFESIRKTLDSNPPIELPRHLTNDGASSVAPGSTPMSAQNSSNGASLYDRQPQVVSIEGSSHSPVYDPTNLPRRQLYHDAALKVQEMLLSLEEKNHVISTANEALRKQLNRIDAIWPHLCDEFSDEAKWGSTTHWAYPENRAGRANNNNNNNSSSNNNSNNNNNNSSSNNNNSNSNSNINNNPGSSNNANNTTTSHAQAERSRREGAASLSAAAQQIAEEAAARSDARKQAVAAKKEKNQQKAQPAPAPHESEAEEHHETKQKTETSTIKKTSSSSKSRKPAQATAAAAAAAAAASAAAPTVGEATTPIGLGITAPAPPANGNPAPKRRKVEKPANTTTNGAAPMERAMSSVFGVSAQKAKTTSPRETPAPDNPNPPKKRKALPTSGNQPKKSRNGATKSPSVASSPVIGSFPEPAKVVRNSPVPVPIPPTRTPAASRAKGPPALATPENGRQRAGSSASSKPNGVITPIPLPEAPAQTNGAKPLVEPKPAKEPPVAPVAKSEVQKPEVVESTTAIPPPIIPPSRKEVLIKAEEVVPAEAKKEHAPMAQPAAATTTIVTTVTTKSGRASKPSTPAIGSFPDAPAAAGAPPRPRPSRNSENSTVKRSHKKGASAALAAAILNPDGVPGGGGGGVGDPKKAKADDEDLYCYCRQPSYGEMIACDGEGCELEWFHLSCAGLKAAPKGNVKWYCKDCKKRLNIPEKKPNGV